MSETCKNCFAPLAPGARFCTECGAVSGPGGRANDAQRPARQAPQPVRPAYDPPATFQDGQPVWQKPQKSDWNDDADTAVITRGGNPEGARAGTSSREDPFYREEKQAARGYAPERDYSPRPERGHAQPPRESRWAPVSIGAYIGLLFLFLIPGINILTMIVWACGASKKRNVTSFARAALITLLLVALLVFGLLFYLINYTAVGQLLDMLITQ